MIFKCRLRIIFAERNIKQGDFAERIGISQTTLSLIVREKSTPRLDVAYRIAKALDMYIEEIWIPKAQKKSPGSTEAQNIRNNI